MSTQTEWITTDEPSSQKLAAEWKKFFEKNKCDLSSIKKIDFTSEIPIIIDQDGRKFKIDFNEDKQSYHKKKGSIKTELLSRALGAGRYGTNLLDLTAGLGIDSLFLCQLGYQVTAIERNPIIFMALQTAQEKLPEDMRSRVRFIFASAAEYLKKTETQHDVALFDPMFPEKKKTALPKQEMVLFKNLVGSDEDASEVIEAVLQSKSIKRLAVKRPLKAPELYKKAQSKIEGKLIRFDIYGVNL